MSPPVIRDAAASDFDRILELNAAEQEKTSPLNLGRLRQLHAWSACHKVALLNDTVVAFVLAIDGNSGYDSSNYRWFTARYRRMLYIDRIVVEAAHAGAGIGRLLYQALIAQARANALPMLACEYNIVPPNPASAAFHARFGFIEIGRRYNDDGDKQLSMQILLLSQPAGHDG